MPDDSLGECTGMREGDPSALPGVDSRDAKPAFPDVIREHGAMIKRIAASYEANANLAEELVQDILFALWRGLPSFRGDGSVRAFVARIATNRSVTHVKKAIKLADKAELSEDLPAPEGTPESQLAELDERARLLALVRSLPLAYRQTVMLTLEGLTGDEIAAVLGISANAVAIRMFRAKDLLRARLRG